MFLSNLILLVLKCQFQIRVITLIGIVALGIAQSSWASVNEISVTERLSADDGIEGDNFGSAIAIDDNIMVVAAPWADHEETSGLIYVYLRESESQPWVFHQHLVPALGHFEDNFQQMTLVIDGDTIIVGAPYARINVAQEGAVYIFEQDNQGQWSESKRLTDISVGTFGHFGTSLSLDGNILAIGAPETSLDRHGRVGIFDRNRGGENEWGRVTTLYGYANFSSSVDDAGNARNFGSAVALKDDMLFIGASRASVSYINNYDGAVYLFRRNNSDPDQWDYISRIVSPGADQCVGGEKLSEFILHSTTEENIEARRCAEEDINTSHDFFGDRISLYSDRILIGARNAEHDENNDIVGAAYLFQQGQNNSDQWNLIQKFQDNNISGFSYLGDALAMSENTIIVGAKYETHNTLQNQGAAYVYEYDANEAHPWVNTEKLIASEGLSHTNFATSVALDGNTRLIGAPGYSARLGTVYRHVPKEIALEEPCSPSFDTTAQLNDGGVVTHSSGVMLGTVQGTLSTNASIWIHEISAPPEPVFYGAQIRGNYYNIGSECEIFAPQDLPFIIGLPVPEGTDTSRLGAAVLAPEKSLIDGPTSGRFWQPVRGSYDASERLYMITSGALIESGYTVVLVNHLDLKPLDSTTARFKNQRSIDPEFLVQCVGFASGCGATEEMKVREKLVQAYKKFESQGFPAPALDHVTDIWISTNGSFEITSSFSYKQIYIRSSADPVCHEQGHHVRAYYNPNIADGIIVFCIDPAGGFPNDDELEDLANHELFHAIQYAYPDNYTGKLNEWVREGTATAAESSEQHMYRRTSRPLRNLSKKLAQEGETQPESLYPYQAQDFWIHLFTSTNPFGQKRDLNVGMLGPLIENGLSTDSVASYLANNNDLTFDDLGQEYWIWAKNQVIEKTDVTFDNTLQNPCKLEGLASVAAEMNYPAQDQVVNSLESLQSELIKIIFSDPENPTEDFNDIRVIAEGENIKYKVYLVEDVATDPLLLEQNCVDLPDGGELGRSFDQLAAQSVVYVLLSQTSHDDEATQPLYRVWIDREVVSEPETN